jgi:ubiquinone/menaquinone biosynthesis C-methylase UbiE
MRQTGSAKFGLYSKRSRNSIAVYDDGMKPWIPVIAALLACSFQEKKPEYETREKHDPNGIGKFYMGREIAHVLGPKGIPWLDRPEREDEEHPVKVVEALDLKGEEVVADLGAGSGYFTFRLAAKVGKVLAVDIQDKMVDVIRKRAAELRITNVEPITCTETDPKLPEQSVDIVLMVDVYHELAFPYEVMRALRKALKPEGRVVLVEYRKEDPKIPIKEVHKMSEEQIKKEMAVVGLVHVKTVGTLPRQHIAIFSRGK